MSDPQPVRPNPVVPSGDGPAWLLVLVIVGLAAFFVVLVLPTVPR